MKRSLIIMAFAGLLTVSCGTVGTTSTASRFQDGIYYQAQEPEFTPLTQEEIASRAALGLKSRQYDTLVLVVEPYPYTSFGLYPWYGYYGYRWYRPGFAWSYPDPFWDPYWNWYCWDPFWDPYWYGPSYWYDPWYYHHHHYYPSYGHTSRTQWASHPGISRSSSGVISRSAASSRVNLPRVSRSASSTTRSSSASIPRSSSVNRTSPATRTTNSAAYNSGVQRQGVERSRSDFRQQDSFRSSSSNSFQSSGSSMSRGSSGGSMSHGSSGSMSHGGSGRR